MLSCPVLSCPVLSCPVLSCPVLSCSVLLCSVLFCSIFLNLHRPIFGIAFYAPPLFFNSSLHFFDTHPTAPHLRPSLSYISSISFMHIEFMTYSATLMDYLSVLEQRLFSEGLYEIGGKMRPTQLLGYLDAVYGERSDKSQLD